MPETLVPRPRQKAPVSPDGGCGVAQCGMQENSQGGKQGKRQGGALLRLRQCWRGWQRLRLLRRAGWVSRWQALALLGLLGLQSLHGAQAGRGCDEKQLSGSDLISAMTLAGKTRQTLEASGAQVALIARVGQDLSKYRLRYSHMAFVWRDHPQGRWLVVHELNHCGTAESALYDEGLGNFFMDDLFAFETKIIIPGAESQARLANVLASGLPLQLHSGHYNMLAHPFSTRYQNSNQWVLEVLAAAQVAGAAGPAGDPRPGFDRAAAQAWLRRAGFRATTLHLSTMTRLGARMFRANVAFDDQPFDRRMAGEIDTTSVDAVVKFVLQREPDASEIVLTLP